MGAPESLTAMLLFCRLVDKEIRMQRVTVELHICKCSSMLTSDHTRARSRTLPHLETVDEGSCLSLLTVSESVLACMRTGARLTR